MRSIGDVVKSALTRDPVVEEARESGRLVDLPEVRRASRESGWRSRGIPERLWPMLHDGAPDETVGPLAPKPSPALEAVGRFTSPSERRLVLVLAGPVDSGKTTAAAWAAAWAHGRLVKAIDLLRAGLYPDDHGFWPRLYAEHLLVVDDLGTEPLDAKGFGLAAISDLIDRRYDGARKTILTTNLPGAAFRSRFGERLWRRLVEVGMWIDLAPLERK